MTESTTPESQRPEPKTKTLPNGDTVFEADDCRFVMSPSRTVHERDEWPGDDHDYQYHPRCGQRLRAGSLWGRVDADTAEEAVMKYNLVPCTKCFANSRRLERWRMDVHSATVIHNADTPERWDHLR